jgi:hypothetical protein
MARRAVLKDWKPPIFGTFLLHAEMVAFDALLEMIGDIVEGIRTQAAANRRFDCGRNVLAPSVPIFPGDIRG